MPSQLERAAAAWHAAIAAGDARTRAELLRRWRGVQHRIEHLITQHEARIRAAHARGESPGVTALHERGRLHHLRDEVERQVTAYGGQATGIVDARRRTAAREAIQWSERLVRTVAPTAQLSALQADVVEAAIAHQAPGGPLATLMAEMGPEAGKRIGDALTQGITLGQNPHATARAIRADVLPSYPLRAQVIARTETMRAVRAATAARYEASEVVTGWTWWSSLDRTVCPSCLAMHGTEHPASETLESHPGCFPAGTVVSGPRPLAATRRPYEGQLVTIRTAAGHLLTGTPNHPVATRCGWVPLDLLQPGDEVISGPLGERTHTAVDPDHQDNPPLIEDVAESLRRAGPVTTRSVPHAPEQFHGDGLLHGQVEVVTADSLLGLAVDAALGKPPLHELFIRRGVELQPLAGESDLATLLLGVDAPSGRCIGCGRVGTPLFGGPLSGDDRVLAKAPTFDSGFLQSMGDDSAGYAECTSERGFRLAIEVALNDLLGIDFRTVLTNQLLTDQGVPLAARAQQATGAQLARQAPGRKAGDRVGDSLGAFAGDVPVDRVIEVGRRDFSGHVYNLETSEGWYSANGIIVHNCRCVMLPAGPGIGEPVTPGEDVLRAMTEEDQRAILGPTRYELWRTGQLRLADMTEQRTNRRWGRSRQVAALTQGQRAASLRRARA